MDGAAWGAVSAMVVALITALFAWLGTRNKASKQNVELLEGDVEALRSRLIEIEKAEENCRRQVTRLHKEIQEMKLDATDKTIKIKELEAELKVRR